MEKSEIDNMKLLGEKIEKLAVVIGHLKKDGTNTYSSYNYISNEQMTTALRNNCLEYRVSIVPSITDYVENEFTNEKNKLVIRTIVTMDFKIIDLDTGFSINQQFIGAEQDTGGKSFQQAVTQCTKYFYFKLFNVSSTDEVDPDGVTAEVTPRNAPKNAPKNNPDKTWLTQPGVDKILKETDGVKVQQYLDYYATDTHGMKKDFRTKINDHLKTLKK